MAASQFDFAPIDALLESAEAAALGGCELVLRHGGRQVYQRSLRGYSQRQRQPIASATKWLTAGLILRLCSQPGFGLSLDDSPAKWLAGWGADDPRKQRITLRMLLSHTHGLPGAPKVLDDRSLPLRKAASLLGEEQLLFEPGGGFFYGESGMQLAGAIAEEATSLGYVELCQRELAEPLGVPELNFIGPSGRQPAQPHLGGGVHCSAPDYAVFLQALYDNWLAAQGGSIPAGSPAENFRIKPELMLEMFSDQTSGIPTPFDYTPYILVKGRSTTRYGLGCWREDVGADGSLLRAGSQGRMGTSPWIDFGSGIFGALWMDSDFVAVGSMYEQLKSAAAEAVYKARALDGIDSP